MKPFDCKMCGECCRGEGGVFVTAEELERISSFLRMTSEAFLDQYCDRRNGKIYLATGDDGVCLLYDHGCGIHPVKPTPCRQWPFFDAMMKDPANLEVAKHNCPGVDPDCTYEEFLAQGRKHRASLEEG